MKKQCLKALIYLIIATTLPSIAGAQGFWFGPKAGLGLNFQRWNNSQRNAIITPHLDFFLESYTEDNPSSLYAQIGFHTRGSTVRFNFINSQSGFDYRFNNIVLGVGGKRFIRDADTKWRPYYILGIRGEYTVSTNLSDYQNLDIAITQPIDEYVNKFNYGVTLGAGFNYVLGDLYSGFVEFSIQPDLSRQYEQPPLSNVVVPSNPFITSNTVNLRERNINNLAFEVTVGIRFLRKVEYID